MASAKNEMLASDQQFDNWLSATSYKMTITITFMLVLGPPNAVTLSSLRRPALTSPTFLSRMIQCQARRTVG